MIRISINQSSHCKTILFAETTMLFISNSVRIFYFYVPGVGHLNSLFCPGAPGVFVCNDCPGACSRGLSQGGMVLDEIDICMTRKNVKIIYAQYLIPFELDC